MTTDISLPVHKLFINYVYFSDSQVWKRLFVFGEL